MSRKGLTKRGQGYREHIEGWTCDYARESLFYAGGNPENGGELWCPDAVWKWVAWADRSGGVWLGSGDARTLGAARAAARAVVMERETRGLRDRSDGRGLCETINGVMCVYMHKDGAWHWLTKVWRDDGRGFPSGTAPTLPEARKAAREASDAS